MDNNISDGNDSIGSHMDFDDKHVIQLNVYIYSKLFFFLVSSNNG
jgi:hypothetical protein